MKRTVYTKKLSSFTQNMVACLSNITTYTKILLDRDAQTSGVRSPGRLNFIWWRLTLVGYQYGNHFVLSFEA